MDKTFADFAVLSRTVKVFSQMHVESPAVAQLLL